LCLPFIVVSFRFRDEACVGENAHSNGRAGSEGRPACEIASIHDSEYPDGCAVLCASIAHDAQTAAQRAVRRFGSPMM
jgi:hypothetical protein